MNGQYEFGEFRLNVPERLLLRGGEPVSLAPKVFDLLVVLVENPGRLLDKERLLRQLWPDTFVEESNLSVNVSALRKALGEQAGQAQFIETVPKKGYRFVADVSAVGTAPVKVEKRLWTQHIAWAVAGLAVAAGTVYWGMGRGTTQGDAIRSVAVLPFRSLVRGEADDALGAGMADALIMKLAGVRQIAVRPTQAILRFRDKLADPIEAGRSLGVDAVLQGLIQREGKRIRITVQLMRVRDGAALWGSKFDDSFTNLFAVQDSISERVADSLSLHLTVEEKEQLRKRYTESTTAFEHYQMGQHFASRLTADDARRALDYFDLARKEDPRYPLAYAGMAGAYVTLGTGTGGFTPELREKAAEAARKALSLDERVAEGHLAEGWIKMYADWDWAGAERSLRRALELTPSLPMARMGYASLLTATGRAAEAVREVQIAKEQDPGSVLIHADLGWTLIYARRYREAADQLRRALEMDSSRLATRANLAKAYLLDRRFAEALETVERGGAEPLRAEKARVLAGWGRLEEARGIADELRRPGSRGMSSYGWALLESALGNKDRAMDHLEAAFREKGPRLLWIRSEPEFDGLRGDARFQALLGRMNLRE